MQPNAAGATFPPHVGLTLEPASDPAERSVEVRLANGRYLRGNPSVISGAQKWNFSCTNDRGEFG